jgi:hypothetical protein
MKRGAVLVLLTLPLAGCFADQKQQLASCKLEAIKLYPNEDQNYSIKVNHYVTTCMGVHNYEYDGSKTGCGVTGNEQQPCCYEPTSWVGRLLYDLETRLTQ